jgi:uncharacterized protein (DUF2235 family)
MSKNIALCFDGTWNKPVDPQTGQPIQDLSPDDDPRENPENTNVVKLKRLIDTGIGDQDVFYFNGVGTQWYNHLSGGIAGAGLNTRIKLGYQRLAEHFTPGDRIYLFGFSRGAYTARSLGGMIRKCGVLRRDRLDRLDAAFDLYRRRDETADAEDAQQFRQANSVETAIHFIGVWDTVGSLGIPLAAFRGIDNVLCGFHDTSLSSIIKHGYHAVAIDENRKQYAPTLWTGQPDPGQTIEQRWFIGAHSNVGGGYADDRLSDLALAWMYQKASACGLRLKPFVANANDCRGAIHDSYKEFLGSLNFLYRWFSFRFYRPINFGTCGQALDRSPVDRLEVDRNYHPKNLRRYGTVVELAQYIPATAPGSAGVAVS